MLGLQGPLGGVAVLIVQCWRSLPGQWVEGGLWRGSLALLPLGMPWQALPHITAGSQVHLVKRVHTKSGGGVSAR